jgi:hypothetical protein
MRSILRLTPGPPDLVAGRYQILELVVIMQHDWRMALVSAFGKWPMLLKCLKRGKIQGTKYTDIFGAAIAGC